MQQRSNMLLCSQETQCGAPSSIVNMFLFKPPVSHPYQFANEVIRLQTSTGNKICATYIERPGAAINIVFSHGNAEDLNTAYRFMQQLSVLLDANVVGYDYSGYGSSTGYPSEEDCYADIRCVFDYLTEVLNIPPEHIVLYGRSLGSGPSCYMAEMSQKNGRPVAGLVLHAAFASVLRCVLPSFFTATFFGDPFPNIDRMKQIECPVFIAHGEQDRIVPYRHGVELFNALPQHCRAHFFGSRGMYHNCFDSVQDELALFEALNQYLDYHVLARGSWMRKLQCLRRDTKPRMLYADL